MAAMAKCGPRAPTYPPRKPDGRPRHPAYRRASAGIYTPGILREWSIRSAETGRHRRVAERARRTPPGTWIVAPADAEVWDDKQFPSRDDLGAVTPTSCVLRSRASTPMGEQQGLKSPNHADTNPKRPTCATQREPTGLCRNRLRSEAHPADVDRRHVHAMREVQGMLENVLTAHDFDGPRLPARPTGRASAANCRCRAQNVNDTYLDHAILWAALCFGDSWLRLGGLKSSPTARSSAHRHMLDVSR